MKATYAILLLEVAATILLGGCSTPISSESSPKIAPDDYAEVLPNVGRFRTVVRRVTAIRITYDPFEAPVTITVFDPADIAEIKNILLSESIAPHPGLLGLGSEPVISAFQDGERLFDLRWQYPEKIRVFAKESGGWGGTYLVSQDWRTRYLEYCSRMKQRYGGSPNQPNQTLQPTAPLSRG